MKNKFVPFYYRHGARLLPEQLRDLRGFGLKGHCVLLGPPLTRRFFAQAPARKIAVAVLRGT